MFLYQSLLCNISLSCFFNTHNTLFQPIPATVKMPSTLKIAILAFAAFVAAVPSSPNNDDGTLFAVESQ